MSGGGRRRLGYTVVMCARGIRPSWSQRIRGRVGLGSTLTSSWSAPGAPYTPSVWRVTGMGWEGNRFVLHVRDERDETRPGDLGRWDDAEGVTES